MVNERIAWFEDYGSPVFEHEITVERGAKMPSPFGDCRFSFEPRLSAEPPSPARERAQGEGDETIRLYWRVR